MTAKWLPVEGGIVPLGDPSGPTQEEERFAALERALEDARGEYSLRRYDAAEAILGTVIPTAEAMPDHRYSIVAASAHSLKARIHWRRAERGLEYQNEALVQEERAKQDAAFRKAIELFRRHEHAITADMPESRLYTDYAIALFRTDDTEAAIRKLERAQATGVVAADTFAYLGMAYCKSGDSEKAIVALKKGLQLAPGDKVLLETLAVTFEDAEKSKEALRTYCRAAVAAGKDDDLASAQRLLRAALKIKQDDAQALSMLTLLLRSQGDDTAAKQLLDATLEKFPTDPWALGLRAMILRDQGNNEAALSDFSRARVQSADLAWVLLEHAKTVGASDRPTARKLLQQASRLLGKDDARVAQVGVQLQVQIAVSSVAGMGRKAIDWLRTVRRVIDPTVPLDRSDRAAPLRKIIERLPDRVEPREALARLLLDQEKYTEVVAVVDEALAIAPDSASLLGLKAKALDLKGDLAEAVRFYRRASRAAPGDDDVFGAFIGALTRASRSEEALNEVEHRLALFQKNGLALAEKGRLLYAAGRFEDAAEALQDAEPLVRDDTRFAVRMKLAEALSSLDRYSEALEALDRAAQVDNELGDAHAHKAAILAWIAEYDQAAAVLEQAIGRIPDDTSDDRAKRRLGWLWRARGAVLRQAGKTPVDQLKLMFEKATTLAPHDPHAKMALGWALLHEVGGQAEGERLIRELIEECAGNNVREELVAWGHFMLKQYDVAEHWLRSTVNGDPANIETRFDLALSLLAMNRDDAAKEYAVASKLAREEKTVERRRGLLHVAVADLIDAVVEGHVDPARAKSVWQDLWKDLQAAGVRDDELARLQYPAAEETRAIAAETRGKRWGD